MPPSPTSLIARSVTPSPESIPPHHPCRVILPFRPPFCHHLRRLRTRFDRHTHPVALLVSPKELGLRQFKGPLFVWWCPQLPMSSSLADPTIPASANVVLRLPPEISPTPHHNSDSFVFCHTSSSSTYTLKSSLGATSSRGQTSSSLLLASIVCFDKLADRVTPRQTFFFPFPLLLLRFPPPTKLDSHNACGHSLR